MRTVGARTSELGMVRLSRVKRRVLGSACLLAALAATSADAATPRLRAFDSCPALVRYASGHAHAVARPAPTATAGPEARPAPAATPNAEAAPDDVSTTNVQEAGVDEPDLVKSDGRHLFAIAAGTLYAVDARTATPRIVGTLTLPGGFDHQLLVHEGRALVIAREQMDVGPLPRPLPVAGAAGASSAGRATAPAMPVGPLPPIGDIAPYVPPRTVLAEVDLRDPARMAVVRTLAFDGAPVGARLTGATARVVVASAPRFAIEPAARDRVAGWVPTATLAGRGLARPQTRRLVACRHVRRPPAFSGTGLLTVLTVDVDRGLPAIDSDAVMTDAEIVAASPRSLYVATPRWDPAASTTTTIHRFDTSAADATTYASSGAVPGTLLSQFALSERDGVLRAASTTDRESLVTTLRQRDGRLEQLGQVGGLGPDERIRAVRFLGPVGYVVTFRQTDPLYTVDLADPERPRVAGELKLLGYSAYLHPIADGRLLGVGQDATEQGRVTGTQVSLFDVSDPARPVRVARHDLGLGSWSEAESDHHAFLWWPATRLAVLPVSQHAFTGALGLRVGAGGIAEAGRVAGDGGAPVRRATVVGDRLFLLGDTAMQVVSLATLAPGTTLPLTGLRP